MRYRAPEGLHDDCVCALALAVQLYRTEFDATPLRLINTDDADGDDGGESFIERAIRRNGAYFPSDWH